MNRENSVEEVCQLSLYIVLLYYVVIIRATRLHYMLGGIYLYCLRVVRGLFDVQYINTYENDREKMYTK